MTEKQKIKSGAPKRSPVCYQARQDIVIPAGTVLRHVKGDIYECSLGEGGSIKSTFSITAPSYVFSTPQFQRVIA